MAKTPFALMLMRQSRGWRLTLSVTHGDYVVESDSMMLPEASIIDDMMDAENKSLYLELPDLDGFIKHLIDLRSAHAAMKMTMPDNE